MRRRRAPTLAVVPPSTEPRRAYPLPADLPTQQGPRGVRFDFNDGCRVMLPLAAQRWQVRWSDLDTGAILAERETTSGWINSARRYFARARLQVWHGGERVLVHDYDAAERDVLVQFPEGTLGDALGWFPYAVKFREAHGCRLTCAMDDKVIALLRGAYPDVAFVTHAQVDPERYYATYSLGLFFDDVDLIYQPRDFRAVGLHRAAAGILGVDPAEAPPRLALDDDTRPIPEPYVCIAVQSTAQCKYWNNPDGWRDIVAFLKQAGYRVICIDQKPAHGRALVWNHIPNDAEDETGDRPLQERARWLRHAAFFVGLSSGLAWLAWATGIPVVMISGFSLPLNEFATPYRVSNADACHGCWNDARHRFDHKDFLWCPRHKGTSRQFECTRLITAEHVKAVLRSIPDFGIHRGNDTKRTPRPGGSSRRPQSRRRAANRS